MSQNNYPAGGYTQQPTEAKGPRQKKEKINSVELTGLVESRARDQEIKYYAFSNGNGGAIHFNVKTSEPIEGQSDANGYPKMKIAFVPVTVRTNKNISEQQLRSIQVGMKVHVVGRIANQQYEDRNGNKRSSLEVEAYVFEIQAMPMQSAPNAYHAPGQYPPQGPYPPQPPQYGGQPQYGAQPPYPGQQYPPQQGPQYGGQPQYGQQYPPQQGPQYGGQPQYGQQLYPRPQYPTPGQNPQQGQQNQPRYNDPNDLPVGDVNLDGLNI